MRFDGEIALGYSKCMGNIGHRLCLNMSVLYSPARKNDTGTPVRLISRIAGFDSKALDRVMRSIAS